jgi:hypothetical protein
VLITSNSNKEPITFVQVCANIGRGEWTLTWGTPLVPKCIPGCLSDSDCQDPSRKHCSKTGQCERTKCPALPNDAHSKFISKDNSW